MAEAVLTTTSLKEEEEDCSKRDTVITKARKFIDDRVKKSKNGTFRVAIFTHPNADPDAIGSQMGLAFLLRKHYDAEVDCYYDGHISHPQNERMVNLLDPELKFYKECDPTHYDFCVSVDTVPNHSVHPEDITFDFVVDHHKESVNGGFKGFFLNLKAGSCCATIYQLIKEYGIEFDEDNEIDSRVATALMVGIITDTEYQTSDDTTDYEHVAFQELFKFRNPLALKQITHYKQPRDWVHIRAKIASEAPNRIRDGVLIYGIGPISESSRDLVAAAADEMLSWEGVETAIAFALVEGVRIVGSVRTENAGLSVPKLCKELCGTEGNGGGKLGKGAYSYNLGDILSTVIDDDCKDKMWLFFDDFETKRLLKVIKK